MSLNLELWLPTFEETFFTLHRIILLANHVTSILLWILGKSYLKQKISSYIIQLHGLGSRLTRSSIHKVDYQSAFSLLHRLVSSNDGSQPILSLSYSMKAASPTKVHICTKQHQSPWRYYLIKAHGSSLWHIISFSAHESHWRNFGSRGLEGQEVCSLKLQQFKVDNRNMLLWHVFSNSLNSNGSMCNG